VDDNLTLGLQAHFERLVHILAAENLSQLGQGVLAIWRRQKIGNSKTDDFSRRRREMSGKHGCIPRP
jgi:hypothetical protein